MFNFKLSYKSNRNVIWYPKYRTTLWTNSYFVTTVGEEPLQVIKQYIENQKNV